MTLKTRAYCVISVFAAVAGHTAARAQSVQMNVASLETFVNVPVQIEIVIKDIEKATRPRAPQIPEASLQLIGGPNRSSRMSFVNGVTTQSVSTTYTYQFVPRREGEYDIPPFEVRAGGKTYRTQAQKLIVTRSDTSDVMFVEVVTEQKSVYVGEQLTATLQIWLRPFRQGGRELDGQAMWRTIDQRASRFGPFISALENSNVTVHQAFREDSAGTQRAYFVYELQTQIWAERPGAFDPGDVSIVVQYPEKLGRVRDPFDIGILRRNRIGVTHSRPLAQAPDIEPIEIKAIPEQGRPAYYRGAVGRYDIQTSARPLEVSVGDPVTLNLIVSGTGRLETLQPPPLDRMTALTEDFKVPPDPIAGVVEGGRKRFSQSIRPKREAIDHIPAIPFSYFDPLTEKFVTVFSNPISLTVRPAHTLALSEVIEADGGGGRGATELKELSGGILANYSGMDEVLSPQGFEVGWVPTGALVFAPSLFLFSLIIQRRGSRLRTDRGYARRKRAFRQARKRLQSAASADHDRIEVLLADIVTRYVADRCNLPGGGLTRTELTEQLMERGIDQALVAEVDDVLESFENAKYAALPADGDQRWVRRVEQCIARLEKEGL